MAEGAPAHVHKGTLHKGFAPTCTENGEKDYYTCSCGKYFEDEECSKEIKNLNDWKVMRSAGHKDWNKDAKCDVCGAWLDSPSTDETTKPGENTDGTTKPGELTTDENTDGTTKPGGLTTDENTDGTAKPGGQATDENGAGSAKPSQPAANQPEKAAKSPATGDNETLLLWSALLLVSGGVIAISGKRKKQAR